MSRDRAANANGNIRPKSAQGGEQTIAAELEGLGLSKAQAAWAVSRYAEKALELVREDPYRLAELAPGVGFRTADQVASRLGWALDSSRRIRAGIAHALTQATDDGHSFLPFHRLVQEAQALLEVERRLVSPLIEEMGSQGLLVIEAPPAGVERDRSVYLPVLHEAEVRSAEILLRLGAAGSSRARHAEEAIALGSTTLGLSLAPAQTAALFAALSRRLCVITGGPGTGKTTVLRALLAVCERMGLRVLLCAPTGRAARRMSEATGREASTIHRMLEYTPGGIGFRRNRGFPLDCGMLVVDEASMVDVMLLRHLLEALPADCSLLLVGDANQLPSVGAGRVLGDIIDSGAAAVVELTEVFRQARESDIVSNAHRVLLGLLPEETLGRERRDFRFIETEDPRKAVNTIVDLVRDTIPRLLSIDPVEGIQILTPMRKGEAGSVALNAALQRALNPDGAPLEGASWLTGPAPSPQPGVRPHLPGPAPPHMLLGDKVIQRRNNYEKGVFNGDIGRIAGVDRGDGTFSVSFDGERISYPLEEAGQLSLAYALTVHKAQGAEYPAVVLALLGEHAVMLQRTLLYTALTRARRLMIVVGSRAALQAAVRRTEARRRFTGLAEKLRSARTR